MHTHESEPALPASPHVSMNRELDDADPTVVQAAMTGRTDAVSSNAVLDLQRLAGNSSVDSMLTEESEEPSPVYELIGSGGGAPLDSSTRSFMESRLGHDFSDVRIHTGPKADESAKLIDAQAYTVGTDVVFRAGLYQPETQTGQRMLAHELTHVIQQKTGPVAGTSASGGINISDPLDRFEQAAEQTAVRVVAAGDMEASNLAAGQPASVQRETVPGGEEEKEDEDELGKARIQRVAGAQDRLLEDM